MPSRLVGQDLEAEAVDEALDEAEETTELAWETTEETIELADEAFGVETALVVA